MCVSTHTCMCVFHDLLNRLALLIFFTLRFPDNHTIFVFFNPVVTLYVNESQLQTFKSFYRLGPLQESIISLTWFKKLSIL